MSLPALAIDIDRACRLKGQFTLRSGRTATEYFDKYLFEAQRALLRRVAEAMRPLIPGQPDFLGGLELGGVPIATMLSSLTGIPALFVRKRAKTYGTCRLAEGGDVEGKSVVLIEDALPPGARSAMPHWRSAHEGRWSPQPCASLIEAGGTRGPWTMWQSRPGRCSPEMISSVYERDRVVEQMWGRTPAS